MSADITNLADHRPAREKFTRCEILSAGHRAPVRIGEISARGARLKTEARPPIGSEAALVHPDVGAIVAEVSGHTKDEISITFERTPEASAFAIAVLANRMSRAPRD